MTRARIEASQQSPTGSRVGSADRSERWTRWAAVLGVAFLATAAAATAARWASRSLCTDPACGFERTVWPHATAMAVVVWLALATAVPLLRARLLPVAVLACAGAAFGPLRQVAAPVIGDLEFADVEPTATQAAWPIAVAAVLTVSLTAAARWLAGPLPDPDVPLSALTGVAGLVCLSGPLLAILAIPGATIDPGHDPGLSLHMVMGWGLLAGGLLAAGLLGIGSVPAAGGRLLLAAGAPGLMWWAYQRDGGWPGVPGWDHLHSPLFLTVQIAAVLVLCALLGWALRIAPVGHRRRTATHEPERIPAVG